MQRPIVLQVLRGLSFRTGWALLYVLHLALVGIAFALFCGVAIIVIDSGGGLSGPARRDVTVARRCTMGLVYGAFGILTAAGAVQLKRCFNRINPLYPEMQIGLHLPRVSLAERLPEEPLPRAEDPMYDRELDQGM
jgi:hypothetical protein